MAERGDLAGLTQQVGAWTISHVPGSMSTYDRVLGRMTPWALLVEHETGWRIFQYERARTAEIVTPGGFPVQIVDVPAVPIPVTTPRHEVLIDLLRSWVNAHADEYEEPRIQD